MKHLFFAGGEGIIDLHTSTRQEDATCIKCKQGMAMDMFNKLSGPYVNR